MERRNAEGYHDPTAYGGMRMAEQKAESGWRITAVDGMVCRIEKADRRARHEDCI